MIATILEEKNTYMVEKNIYLIINDIKKSEGEFLIFYGQLYYGQIMTIF